jgi:hypothetical protein
MAKHMLGVLCLALAVPCMAAEPGSCNSLESLHWLLGDWVADGSKKAFHESWRAVGQKTFEGTGIESSKFDSSIQGAEELRLVEMGEGVFYLSKVTHNDLPVAFRLTICEGREFVFENPAHDFPRRIEYRRAADGRLSVRVSDGADKGFTLEFARAADGATASDAVLKPEDN